MAASTAMQTPNDATPDASELVALTLRAIELAKAAVAGAADGLAKRSSADYSAVHECEQELDRIDQEIDERVALAVTRVPAEQVRELLACLKCVTDLERIGDLISSFVTRAQAVGTRVETEDIHDLIRMASVLEKMLVDAYDAFSHRDVNRAIAVLRADAVLDRLRNLIYIRHVEGTAAPEAVQVLFMAQALERAGDHTKNVAEEVCHLVSGHSVRHVLRTNAKSDEQMYLEWLRGHQNSGR